MILIFTINSLIVRSDITKAAVSLTIPPLLLYTKNKLKSMPYWNRVQIIMIQCGQQDLNLHGLPPEPKSGASANSAMPADAIMNTAIYRLYINPRSKVNSYFPVINKCCFI